MLLVSEKYLYIAVLSASIMGLASSMMCVRASIGANLKLRKVAAGKKLLFVWSPFSFKVVDRLLIPSLLIIISDSVSYEPFEQTNLHPLSFLLKPASCNRALSVVGCGKV